MSDAGTIQAVDALDDEIASNANGLIGSIGAGAWVSVALFGVALVVALLKKFNIGFKKPAAPPEVKANADADKAADEARQQLSMKEPKK